MYLTTQMRVCTYICGKKDRTIIKTGKKRKEIHTESEKTEKTTLKAS